MICDVEGDVFDAGEGVDTPLRADAEFTATVFNPGIALSMCDEVREVFVTPGIRRYAPGLTGVQVLQHEPFGGRVCNRVIGPGCKLIEPTVDRPGVTRACFRDLRTKLSV